jgi:hypothetical protein
VSYSDWKPEWAHKVSSGFVISWGNWHEHRRHKKQTFGDYLRLKWNDPKHVRGPHKYFDGILIPVGTDEHGDVVFKYKPWESDNAFRGECNF